MANDLRVFEIIVRVPHDLDDIKDSELYEKQLEWYLQKGFDVIAIQPKKRVEM